MKNVIYKPFIYDSDKESENDFSITPPRGYKSRYTKYEDEEDIIEDIIDSEIEEPTEIDFSLPDINYRFPDKESFKTRMMQEYRSALQARGIDPSYTKALVAQDALESEWGSKPSGLYNYGGIKGNGKTLTTTEYIDGAYINVNDSFRNFDSIQEYVNYKINLLNGPRYKAFSGNVKDFAKRVASGGYATAPNYAEVLNDVIRTLRKGGILKFDGGGKYLEQEREHYNQQVNFNSLLPVFNFPYNLTKHKLNNVQVKHNAPWLLKDEWDGYNGVYNTVTNTIHINDDMPHPSIAENHEKGHIIGQPLVRNVENLIKKWDGDIFEDGVTKDSYYDSPKEILARMYAYLMDSGYGGNRTVRDTLHFIRAERDRFTTEINADLTYSDGTRVRSTRKDGRVIVHDKNIPGTSDVSSAKIYRKYNDPYDIFNRYNDKFINDLFQLFYSMKRDVQLSKRGGSIIRKYSIGGPVDPNIKQQVFDWASNKNGELRYAINHGESYPTFYRLLRDANRPVLDLGDGYTGTHKLSYVQSGDKWYIYPEIQWTWDENGNWSGVDYSQEDDWKTGWEHAYNNGDYLEIPTEEMAKYFTENYKKEFGNWYPGFEETKKYNLENISLFEKFPFSDKTIQEWKKYSGWHPPMEHPDKINITFTPTIEDLAHQLTMAYETYQKMPYILETKKDDGTIQRQELIGHGLANKDLIEKYRKTGIPENVSSQLVIDELNRLNNLFIKMQPNYSKLPWNVRLAILDTAYNTKGENFWANSPKFTEMVQNGIIDPEILVSELDHSKNVDSGWLRDRSAARRALALGKYRWNWQHVDKYGRHYNPNIPLSSKDWTRGLYINNY